MLLAQLLFAALACHAREMETDRPDRTESSETVEKGRVQIELEPVSYKRKAEGVDDISVGAFEARYGVSDSTDIEVQFVPFLSEQSRTEIGDTVLRLKMNITGHQPHTLSVAVMPYVKIPTATSGNGKVEGGLIVPMKFDLPSDFELAFEAEISAMRNKDDSGESAQFVSSYSLGHKIAGDLHGYLEFYSESAPSTDWIATVDTGCTYQLNENNQLDAGVNIGASPAADPVNPFVGYSVRF